VRARPGHLVSLSTPSHPPPPLFLSVVRDPFYIRQAIAPRVLPIMKAHGVRFNDLGTFWRANRVPDQAGPGRRVPGAFAPAQIKLA